jgi:glycosyltransferase involved in cell wall biosynthesis
LKKVNHLITSLEGGGTENFLYQILAHSPAGYEHQVFYLKKDGVIGERIRQQQIPVTKVASPFHLLKALRSDPAAILHTCLYSAHILGRYLGRLAGTKAIINSQRSIDIWQKPWQTWLDKRSLPLAHSVIVNSDAARQIIEQRRGKAERPQIELIPNGVDTTRFQPTDKTAARQHYKLPPDAIVGGSLMRLHREKGADLIPAYAAELLPKNPQLHLLVGGVGPLEGSLKQALAGMPYADRVHLTGWEDQTPEFLTACDFFWSLSREESFPQTLVEASVIGLPLVAPDVGGVAEIIQNGAIGRLFPRLEIAAAASQTTGVLAQIESLKQAASNAAPQLRSHYAIKTMIDRVYAVFATHS